MLKPLAVKDINIYEYPEIAQPDIAFYLHRVKQGKKLDFKLNICKKQTYINVYEYDSKRWKYILVDKIKV